MGNDMWHVALKPGSTELQDVIVANIPFGDMDLMCMLLRTEKLRGKPVETKKGNYLLMMGAEYKRPYPSVMIWKNETHGEENRIVDMGMEDAWIIEYVWREWLMPEDTDAEYVPPESFLVMARTSSGA